MTFTQWNKKLKKRLSALPAQERGKVLAYYEELYMDKRDAGMTEADILAGFGSPEEAAARAAEGSEAPAPKGNAAGRFFFMLVLYLFIGIPVIAVIFSLAVTAAALFLSGFAVLAAGIADFFYFLIQICLYGAGGAYIAHLGIGLGCAGAGALLVPLFLFLTKALLTACGKLLRATGRYIRGKKETV